MNPNLYVHRKNKNTYQSLSNSYRERHTYLSKFYTLFKGPHKDSCTPLWKSNGAIFSTQIIHLLFFVVYHSFHTWHTWVGQYEVCYFYWISITGYIPVTLWKGQLDKNPVSRLSDRCNVHWWHRGMEKTTVIGVYYDCWRLVYTIRIIENLSSYTSRFICGDARSRKKLSKTTDW